MAANYYTIIATMPPDTTKEQLCQMLQNLLAERFNLRFHRETRNFPGYELVVDKGGPKLKEVAPTPDANRGAISDTRVLLDAPGGADGFPKLPPGPRTISESRGGQTSDKVSGTDHVGVRIQPGFPDREFTG